jgi:4-amino-4-deoxychorismate lyase
MIYYHDGQLREGPLGLSVEGEALRYGFGVFETLYWDGTGPCRLREHLARAWASLEALGARSVRCDMAAVIPEVAARNGLARRPGRVNLLFPVQDGLARPVVCAVPYAPPAPDRALRLTLSPHPLHCWLGAHKTMNHLFHHLEHRAALERGFDGAALASPDGHLLETATAALVLADHGQLVTPAPPGAGDAAAGILPSVALASVAAALDIEVRPVHLDDLSRHTHAWVLNSLMGMRPVQCLGEARFEPEFGPCARADALIHAR